VLRNLLECNPVVGLFGRSGRKRSQRNVLARRLRLEALENRRLLTTVTTNLDVLDPDDGVISLREAIRDTISGIINFDTSLNGATIKLDPNIGALSFAKSLTIDGTGRNITIDGDKTPDNAFDDIGIFNIENTTSVDNPPLVTMIGLTLTHAQGGQAIESAARLHLTDCNIVDNVGGGININVAGGDINTQRDILRIDHCDIERNYSLHGSRAAGVNIVSGDFYHPTNDQFVITGNSTISNSLYNVGLGGGEGVKALLYGASLRIDDAAISSNSGGGVVVLPFADASFTLADSVLDDVATTQP
jgi:hypothetical protein